MNTKLVRKLFLPLLHSVWVYVAVFLLAAGLIVAVLSAVLGGQYENITHSTLGNLLLSAAVYVLGAAIVTVPLLFDKPKRHEFFARLGLVKKPTLAMVGAGMVSWGMYMAVSAVVMVVLYSLKINGLDLEQTQEIGYTNVHTVLEYVLVFIGLVILPPVFEEVIFRGYLFGRVRRWWSFVPAALLVSFVFGAVHGQWNVGIDVFILSVFMCFLREKFDSIWPTILMHAMKNGLAYFFLFIWPLAGPFIQSHLLHR